MQGARKLEKIGEDQSINFRPSPNFKHMKKYLKFKFEEAACSEIPVFKTSSDLQQVFIKEVNNKANMDVAVQPPLPLGSPPPDYSPNFMLKKEVIDDGSENNSSQQNDSELEYDNTISEQNDMSDKPRKIMCKDFVRGNCTRDPCIFSHEVDVTQLKGVYKFCRDYANGKCKRPMCNFVHASIFEKETFLRTGVLPPHTLSHLKDSTTKQRQPISEAAVQPCVPIYPGSSSNVVNPTLSEYNSCAPLLSAVMTVPPAAPVDPATYNVFTPSQQPSNHIWNEVLGVAQEGGKEVSNKCINCKLSEISYQQNKSKLEAVEKSTKDIQDNIAMLDQKKAKLISVLTMLWKDITIK